MWRLFTGHIATYACLSEENFSCNYDAEFSMLPNACLYQVCFNYVEQKLDKVLELGS